MIWIILGSIPFALFLIAVVAAMIKSVGLIGTILIWGTTAIIVGGALAVVHGFGQMGIK